LDWWFFAENTEAEAREFLARFLDDGAAGVETEREAARAGGVEPDYSLASIPEMLRWMAARVELVEAPAPADVPDWVQAVVAEHGGGFRDLAEASRSDVLRAAYYLGECFVTTYPVLRWEIGADDRPEVRQPVVTGFATGDDLPVLAVAEAALAGGEADGAVERWRTAVTG
jgi:hypothetical protein